MLPLQRLDTMLFAVMICCAALQTPFGCLTGPLSALLQHLRDQQQSSSTMSEQASAGSSGPPASQGNTAGKWGLEGAINLKGRGLTSVYEDVWQVSNIYNLHT